MKLPRDLSGADIVKALQRLGFRVERQKGCHIQLSKATVHVTVPAHKPVKTGTLNSILKQAGIDADELIENL